ncbi:MAG: DUF5723 family protein [Bacteroidota bacterium]|nr:DUF5723 family protein [Bacteroidota bacterium]
MLRNIYRHTIFSTKGRAVFIFLAFFTWSSLALAQQNQTMYYMGVPQSRFMNPALQGDCNSYFGIPGINSTYLGINNNSVGFEDIIFKGPDSYGDSLISILHPTYDIDEFLAKLKPVNRISPEVYVSLLSFGFRAGENFFFLDVADRMYSHFSFPKDLATLVLKGNEDFINSSADLSSLSASATYFREIGLGFSREFAEGLFIGVKAKMLFGNANVSLQNNGLSLEIDESNLFSHTVNADLNLNFGYPVEVFHDPETGYIDSLFIPDPDEGMLFNFGNPGFGIDLGAVYKINDQFSVSASVVDLGFIKWKKDVTNLRVQGTYEFTGIDVSSMLIAGDTSTFDDALENISDTLITIFNPKDTYDPFTTYTPTKIYIGGSFQLNDNIGFGLLSKTLIEHGKLWESFTMSANVKAGGFLTTSLSYSITNSTYNNVGFGLSLRGGPIQFYFVTDKLFYKLSRYSIPNEGTNPTNIILPSNLSSFNFRFGLNLVFGCKPKRPNDRPLIF